MNNLYFENFIVYVQYILSMCCLIVVSIKTSEVSKMVVGVMSKTCCNPCDFVLNLSSQASLLRIAYSYIGRAESCAEFELFVKLLMSNYFSKVWMAEAPKTMFQV